ncbi:MAG: hypothetical protein NC080_07500 [Paraprevotella sp.]|nr:hypothetical protein [Paraprevotella sp.]
MEIKIAGRSVPIGARLYHKGWDTFGTIIGYDPSGSAEMSIVSNSGQRRRMFVTEGGKVAGVKMCYWHKTIDLDLPMDDVSSIQAVVDLFTKELMKIRGAEEDE